MSCVPALQTVIQARLVLHQLYVGQVRGGGGWDLIIKQNKSKSKELSGEDLCKL